MREMKLPSGAMLGVALAPFSDSKALYQAVMEEMKAVKLDEKAAIDVNFFKDLLAIGLSSKKIESALWDCMKRCTYNSERVTPDTFEPEAARGDYLHACFEVAKDNVMPFTKNLYAQYAPVLERLKKSLG